ncbi:hypothetical protein AAG570_011559 [Ranatra chinensis]|uniref:Uncharacterized protein n=1 Tax=Ranatra chinensis TaxID=642074 RepID=A0ABD0Z778_9HEMI
MFEKTTKQETTEIGGYREVTVSSADEGGPGDRIAKIEHIQEGFIPPPPLISPNETVSNFSPPSILHRLHSSSCTEDRGHQALLTDNIHRATDQAAEEGELNIQERLAEAKKDPARAQAIRDVINLLAVKRIRCRNGCVLSIQAPTSTGINGRARDRSRHVHKGRMTSKTANVKDERRRSQAPRHKEY